MKLDLNANTHTHSLNDVTKWTKEIKKLRLRKKKIKGEKELSNSTTKRSIQTTGRKFEGKRLRTDPYKEMLTNDFFSPRHE